MDLAEVERRTSTGEEAGWSQLRFREQHRQHPQSSPQKQTAGTSPAVHYL